MAHFLAHQETLLRDLLYFEMTAVATEQMQKLRATQMEDLHPVKVTGV